MIIDLDDNPRVHKGKKEMVEVKGEYGGVCGEEEGNADDWGMVQPSQQHVAPSVKVVEWGFGTRGLRMVTALSCHHSFSLNSSKLSHWKIHLTAD